MSTRDIIEGLCRTAMAFGSAHECEPELKYAMLLPSSSELALAIELVYEGYLLHYREGRMLAEELSREERLLAGDYFYASGLRLVARSGNLAAVDLLTQLMAACSYFRVERLPFVWDDDLWEIAALGVGAQGDSRRAALRVFAAVAADIAAGRSHHLPEIISAGLGGVRNATVAAKG